MAYTVQTPPAQDFLSHPVGRIGTMLTIKRATTSFLIAIGATTSCQSPDLAADPTHNKSGSEVEAVAPEQKAETPSVDAAPQQGDTESNLGKAAAAINESPGLDPLDDSKLADNIDSTEVDADDDSELCAIKSVKWMPVESYDGSMAEFPKHAITSTEAAVLTGSCDGTLIGPDLVITAAHCPVKVGSTMYRLRDQHDPNGNPRTPIRTRITEVLETGNQEDAGFEYTIFRISKRLGDELGYTRIAAVELQEGESLGMVHGPGWSPEQVSAGTMLKYDSDNYIMTKDLWTARGSAGAGLLDSSGFLVGTNSAGGCRDGSYVGWHSSMLQMWRNSSLLRRLAAMWQVGGPSSEIVSDGQSALYGLAPNKSSVWKYSGSLDRWTKVGGPATAIFAGGGTLYGRAEGHIYRYVSGESWTAVDRDILPGDEFAVDRSNGDLYRLPADKQAVQKYDGNRWVEVGGPASEIMPSFHGVIAKTPDQSAIWGYSRITNKWTELSRDGSDQIVDTPNKERYKRNSEGVWKQDSDGWNKVGGPAVELFSGPRGQLFALSPVHDRIWRYDGRPQKWSMFGRPSLDVQIMGRRVFAAEKGSTNVVEYRD